MIRDRSLSSFSRSQHRKYKWFFMVHLLIRTDNPHFQSLIVIGVYLIDALLVAIVDEHVGHSEPEVDHKVAVHSTSARNVPASAYNTSPFILLCSYNPTCPLHGASPISNLLCSACLIEVVEDVSRKTLD
ncbi:hypothetical protein Tco_0806173 [Tanacetum coccineum]